MCSLGTYTSAPGASSIICIHLLDNGLKMVAILLSAREHKSVERIAVSYMHQYGIHNYVKGHWRTSLHQDKSAQGKSVSFVCPNAVERLPKSIESCLFAF